MPPKPVVRIYTLSDPRTGVVRYVGQTKNDVNRRLALHMAVTTLTRWILELEAEGVKPVVEVVEEVPSRQGTEAELKWMRHFHEISPILNQAGLKQWSEESRARQRERMRQLWQDPVWAEKVLPIVRRNLERTRKRRADHHAP